MLQLGMIVLAIAVLLQALPRGPVGSRFLAPSIFTGVYLAPSLLAVKARRPAAGLGHDDLRRAGRDRALAASGRGCGRSFRRRSAGLVVFLIGVIIGLAALRVLLEDNPAGVALRHPTRSLPAARSP